MWVVADLNDDYIAKMEDVLEVYERPYDPLQPDWPYEALGWIAILLVAIAILKRFERF